MSKNKNKQIKSDKNIVISSKEPKRIENPESYFDKSPSWSFSKCDLESDKWALDSSDFFADIMPKLVSFERRKWKDIIDDNKHNHWISCDDFCKAAQQRLIELKLYYDELFSLRLTGRVRLFGYIENGVYYIVWYDHDHEICPSVKKHT